MSNSALRPDDWDEYIGQQKLKDRMLISMNSALTREAKLDDTLLVAPAGYGKTSFAALMAQYMMEDFHPYVMPLKPNALRKILLENRGMIFLDEIHRLPPKHQEILLPLEDNEVHFEDGKVIEIPPVTIVAATTELKKVIEPLRDRFTHKPKFELYTDEDMAKIIRNMCRGVGIHSISADHATALGRASAGVPRQARSLVFTARDLGTTDPSKVLRTIGITPDGLTEDHIDYVLALDKLGQIAGVDVLANYTGQPKDVIVKLEKLLLRKNIINYSQKGRVLTTKGYKVAQSVTAD